MSVAVDLHTHSRMSDGSATPADIVAMAAARRLGGLALTDHDTLDGLEEAATAAASAGIRFVPGVELSVRWGGRAMHLLSYWIEPGPGPLQDRLAELRDGRDLRNAQIVDALQGLGIDITVGEVAAQAGAGSVGRPHIAAVLMGKGVVSSIAEAFDAYLAEGRPAYRPRMRLDAGDAVRLTKASGGSAVVAHPHTVADAADGFATALEAFRSLGIDGVECYYGEYTPEIRRRLAATADRIGLIPTGGSDYHGTYKPGLEVGVGRGDLLVPDAVLEALEATRP